MVDIMDREKKWIQIGKASCGLGLKLIGGFEREGTRYGIFVKQVIPGGAASQSNVVNVGDELLAVNEINIQNFSCSRAVQFLREASASDCVQLTLSSDETAQRGFQEVINLQPTSLKISSFKSMSANPKGDVGKNASTKDCEKEVSIFKTNTGLGIRLEEFHCHHPTTATPVTLLRVSSLSREGDVYRDGSIKVGDYLTCINHHSITCGFSLNQIHSLLLREKLRADQKVVFSYIPSVTSLNRVCEVFAARNGVRIATSKMITNDDVASPAVVSNADDYLQAADENIANEDAKLLVPSTDKTPVKRVTRKLSFTNDARIKIGKLEESLPYLDIKITEEKMNYFRERLIIDLDKTAQYGDFIAVFLDVFADELYESQNRNGDSAVVRQVLCNHNCLNAVPESTPSDREEKEKEIARLQSKVNELEKENKLLTKELEESYDRHRKNEQEVKLALAAQQADMERIKNDYEDVIKGLDAEVKSLRGEGHASWLEGTPSDEDGHAGSGTPVDNGDRVEVLLEFVNKVVQSDVKSFSKNQRREDAIKALEKLADEGEVLYFNIRSQLSAMNEKCRHTGSFTPSYSIRRSKASPLKTKSKSSQKLEKMFGFSTDYEDGKKTPLNDLQSRNHNSSSNKKKYTSASCDNLQQTSAMSVNSSLGSLTSRTSSNSPRTSDGTTRVKMRLI